MEKKNNFIVIYAKDDEEVAFRTIKQIAADLNIEYELWSYKESLAVPSYFEEKLEPSIETAEFLLFFLSNSCNNDDVVWQSYQQCVRLNKKIVPVNISAEKYRLGGFEFRTNIFNYSDSQDKENLIDQLHSWLGLATEYGYSETKHCPNCGQVIKTKAVFCKWCGKHFAETNQRVCRKCGNPLAFGALFCGVCGTKQ